MKSIHRLCFCILSISLGWFATAAGAASAPTGDGLLSQAYQGSQFFGEKDTGFIQFELPVRPPTPKRELPRSK